MIKILTVLAIIFSGFVSVVVRGGDSLYEILKTAPLKDYLSGSLPGRVDRAVFDAIPRSAGLNGFSAGLLYKGLRDAGPLVWAGCNDWLYSAEELRVDRRDEVLDDPLHVRVRSRCLAGRNRARTRLGGLLSLRCHRSPRVRSLRKHTRSAL